MSAFIHQYGSFLFGFIGGVIFAAAAVHEFGGLRVFIEWRRK